MESIKKSVYVAIWALCVLCAICFAWQHNDEIYGAQPTSISKRLDNELREISVMVESEGGWGSGIVMKSERRVFVLTCAHVVEDSRTNDTNGVTGFLPVWIHDLRFEGQRVRGKEKIRAEVVAYSEKHDLALLRLPEKTPMPSAVARLASKPPRRGDSLWHVGCLHGPEGQESLVAGVFNFEGRIMNGVEYDQTSVTAAPGSSGGGVYTERGECVGIVSNGIYGHVNLIIPARRITAWLQAEHWDVGAR